MGQAAQDRRVRRTRIVTVVVAATLAVAGCSGSGTDSVPSRPASAPPAGTAPAATPSPTVSAPAPSPVPHPVSLPALMAGEDDGGDLRVGAVLARTDAYTRYAVTYRSSGLRISGVMNVPRGTGPFPVLVLNHGYIDPAVYVTGQGLRREQDYLARAGYVVLHTDYRNHAGSDTDPQADLRLRLGYGQDAVNAVLALKASGLAYVDAERVGMLGRSMGGGVTFQALVTRPGLVDAAVVYAPVSSDVVDNYDRWTRGQPGRQQLADAIVRAYGSPESAPEFWRGVSPRTYFSRITEPVLIHHGTADESCPIDWSRQTQAALRAAGVDSELLVYDGEPHAFGAAWRDSMARTVAFFAEHLGTKDIT